MVAGSSAGRGGGDCIAKQGFGPVVQVWRPGPDEQPGGCDDSEATQFVDYQCQL